MSNTSNFKISRGKALSALALAAFICSVAPSVYATAGSADVQTYLTRGYDGTGTAPATTDTGFFTTDGGSTFSDRMLQSNANRIDEIASGKVDPVTGARLDTSTTPTYVADGSIYLHVGYFNSGYVGSGSTVENFRLNGNLVLGRLGIENVYWETYNEGKDPCYTTPNIAKVITAGNSNYTLTFNYTKGESNELLFFRAPVTSSVYVNPVPATFTLDCNIDFAGVTLKQDKMFIVSTGNHLILGSEDYKRTLTIDRGIGTVTNFIMTEGVTTPSIITTYSDLTVNGMVNYAYRGTGHFNLMGNSVINNGKLNADDTTGFTGYFSLITLSGNGTPTSDPGKAIVNGAVTVNSATTGSMDIFYLNRAGNYLELNGAVNLNAFAGASTTLVHLNVSNTSALVRGNVNVNSTVGSSHLFRLYANNQSVVVDGKITVTKAANMSIARFQTGTSGQSVVFNNDIEIQSLTKDTRLVFFATNGTDSTTLAGTNVVTFNGNITISDKSTFSETILGVRKDYTVTEFFGKIDASTRTTQTSFSGDNAVRAIVNFRGKVDNTFNNIGFRASVFNLLNTNDSAAIKSTASIAFGGAAHLNVFGDKQLQISNTATWQLWGPTNNISGTVNLNGLATLKIGKYDPYGASRRLIIDLGMTDHGMTANQLIANQITADMINETAQGIAQTITIGSITNSTVATVADCYILFKNYVVGEDKIICEVQLSKTSLNGVLCYSQSDINGNILRIDGYTDSDKYGVEYWLEETDLGNGTWEYSMHFIPEPASVASILALLALGFVAYRKRK